jgi:hypothetical protein
MNNEMDEGNEEPKTMNGKLQHDQGDVDGQ